MKRTTRYIALALFAVMLAAALASCGLRSFDNDLRYRYDYDLTDYLKAGKYKGFEVAVGATDVSDEEILSLVRRNQMNVAEEDVTDRPCQSGDLIGISCQAWKKTESGEYDEQIDSFTKGYLLGEPVGTPEEIIELGSSYYFPITLGCDEMFPGFEDQIIGNLSVGEEKTFNYTLPEPYWDHPELSGAEIKITVRLNYITPTNTSATTHSDEEMTAEEARAYYGKSLIDKRTEAVDEYVRVRTWKQIDDSFEVKQYPEKELSETKASLREAYASVAQRKVKEQLKVDVVKEYFAAAAEKNETLDEYIVNDLEMGKDGVRDDSAFTELVSNEVTARLEALSADEIFEKYLTEHLGVTADKFEERIDREAKESVKDEMVVYYIARKEQIGIANIDFEDYVDTNYVESGDYSSIEQYVAYVAYSNKYAAEDEILTEEATEHAKNYIKEQMLYEKVDELVKENNARVQNGASSAASSGMPAWLIVLLICVGCAAVLLLALIPAKWAKTKGYSAILFYFVGLICLPVALVIVFLLNEKTGAKKD